MRVIAFYLPQFIPISENDQARGNGFTEWTNVVRAKPIFAGRHYEPDLPADLAFYDVRVPEMPEARAGLARTHCVSGFCSHHCMRGRSHPSTSPGAAWRGRNFREGGVYVSTLRCRNSPGF